VADIVGPLARVLQPDQPRPSANALLTLRRCALVKRAGSWEIDKERLLAAAVRDGLGQGDGGDDTLLAAVRQRRIAALASLTTSGVAVTALRLVPEPFVVTGVGEESLTEVGLTLHGTYGWPAVRGSTLKGVAHAYARQTDAPDRTEIFGTAGGDDQGDAHRDDPGKQGGVLFLDAVPYRPLPVRQHVMTPHLREYYEPGSADRAVPAEYHNPAPVPFLAIEGDDDGGLLVTLAGPAELVARAATLLRAAVQEIGLGAKTSAGYGYLRAEEVPL
jgi:CRISPR-associated protein Cmr6